MGDKMTVHTVHTNTQKEITLHRTPHHNTAQHKENSFENDRQLFNDDDDIGIVSFVALRAHEKLVFKRIFSIILYTLDYMRNGRERESGKKQHRNRIESNRIESFRTGINFLDACGWLQSFKIVTRFLFDCAVTYMHMMEFIFQKLTALTQFNYAVEYLVRDE